LALAMAIIIVGCASLGWVGGRVVDYTFDEVRENTSSRIETRAEIKHLKLELDQMKEALKELPAIKEIVIRTDERLQNWEPSSK